MDELNYVDIGDEASRHVAKRLAKAMKVLVRHTQYLKDSGFEMDDCLVMEQLDLEKGVKDDAVENYKKIRDGMQKMGKEIEMSPATKLLKTWFPSMVEALTEEIAACKSGKRGKGRQSYGHLIDHDVNNLAVITIHEALSVLLSHVSKEENDLMAFENQPEEVEGNMVRVLAAAQSVGQKVMTELNNKRLVKHYEDTMQNIDPMRKNKLDLMTEDEKNASRQLWNLKKGKKTSRTEMRINAKAREVLSGGDELEVEWSTAKRIQVGAALLQLLIDTAVIPGTKESAFQHKFVYMKGKKGAGLKRYGYIGLDPRLNDSIEELHSHVAMIHAKVLPMLAPPLPWISAGARGAPAGGYLTVNADMMRTKGRLREQTRALQEADLRELFQALNSASRTAWAVNSFVYDNVQKVFDDATELGEVPGLPAPVPTEENIRHDLLKDPDWPGRRSHLGIELGKRNPQFEDFAHREASDLGPTDEQAEILLTNEVKRLRERVKRDNANIHSMRCDLNLKLKIADQLRDRDAFYFPHNVDFRGRIYPISPHFNHLGADFCRAMLRFAEPKPLGERGLYWMKIHLANLAGKDKLTFDGREDYIDGQIENIMDSADNPLDGKQWWLEADEPWQCLAICEDLTQAWRSGDPLSYESAMPVHQDGSCNGLQHYAALGRDEAGASQVDLVPADKPQDVYSGVCRLVQEKVHQDALNENAPAHMLATLLDGKVDRKIVKQTVMTSVYGVTYIGAREQIFNRLKDIDFPEEHIYKGSAYLAKETLGSIGEVFTGADSIMKWLGECAKVIAQQGYDVAWVTPLGLPVVQPYREPKRKAVNTALQQVVLHEVNDQPVMKSRQRSAFPPNFVHSLDSTHLLLTARRMAREDLTFAAVHDSYWTHACDIDRMNVMLREEFVDLHSRPILEDLYATLQLRYPEITSAMDIYEEDDDGTPLLRNKISFSPPPPKGNLDLQKVKESLYFFD